MFISEQYDGNFLSAPYFLAHVEIARPYVFAIRNRDWWHLMSGL